MHPPDGRQAALVAALGDALGTATAPDGLGEEVRAAVAGIREVFGAAACSVALVEPDGSALRFIAADGRGAAEIVGVVLPVGRGIAGWVAMSGESIRVADVAADGRFARDVAESTRFVPSTILAAPVPGPRGAVAGVVEVLEPAPDDTGSGRELAVLGLLAAQLGSVVRLRALYDALGTGLLRSLVDPDGDGDFDDALATLVDAEEATSLGDLARAFRDLAAAGPDAARLAERVLLEVADFARRGHRGPGRPRAPR
ncbi:GAF domain-containing protein [Phycicoccus flavus]|uniref:GAF domain-containing protein n=1 Tax=Phycicoccus flavus TaxID=2502783 RepID=A0A8T6QZL9_9MICO|nr:GAF domain-containing protein [Phycicoccus flavus]NHA67559.1 GAF domain-containing protein [Phycicoccus flavus]